MLGVIFTICMHEWSQLGERIRNIYQAAVHLPVHAVFCRYRRGENVAVPAKSIQLLATRFDLRHGLPVCRKRHPARSMLNRGILRKDS